MKELIKSITPPLLLNFYKKFRKEKSAFIKGEERDANWYDEKYKAKSSYHEHYTKSPYYFVWTVILERLAALKPAFIIDLGCGPGQFARLLSDKGYKNYIGLDFSQETIKLARENCPQFEFQVEDILKTNVLERKDYDCIITLEFLEHIEKDIEVLEKIRSGVTIIATVPSYNSAGHVRYFSSGEEVKERYSSLFVEELHVTEWLLSNNNGARFFLFQGVKK